MTWLSVLRLKTDSISDAGAVNVIYGVAGTTFLNSGLGATVPAGGSGRSDQLWSQEIPGIEDTADGDDVFGRSLKRGHFEDSEF